MPRSHIFSQQAIETGASTFSDGRQHTLPFLPPRLRYHDFAAASARSATRFTALRYHSLSSLASHYTIIAGPARRPAFDNAYLYRKSWIIFIARFSAILISQDEFRRHLSRLATSLKYLIAESGKMPART